MQADGVQTGTRADIFGSFSQPSYSDTGAERMVAQVPVIQDSRITRFLIPSETGFVGPWLQLSNSSNLTETVWPSWIGPMQMLGC